MNSAYSPLRYPGGKRKLSEFFVHFFSSNKIKEGIYVEPYVGGGSIALHLLFNDIISKAIINDKDRSIYAFWYSVLNHNDEICQLIKYTSIDIKTWEIQKEIQRNKESADLLSLGFSTFFLNRTNRSGIIKGGIIGGHNQTGKYKINARFNKEDLINRIKKISLLKNRIYLYNLDARNLLIKLADTFDENTVIYLDPPYYIKGKGLYMNYYNANDHVNIEKTISIIVPPKFVITYDKVDFIKNIYNKYRTKEYNLSYCAQTKCNAKEYMFFSQNCIIPKDDIFKS